MNKQSHAVTRHTGKNLVGLCLTSQQVGTNSGASQQAFRFFACLNASCQLTNTLSNFCKLRSTDCIFQKREVTGRQ